MKVNLMKGHIDNSQKILKKRKKMTMNIIMMKYEKNLTKTYSNI